MPHHRRGVRLSQLTAHLCADPPTAAEAKQKALDWATMGTPENPVPFAGFVEANSQHVGGIGVLEGTAPNDLHAQYLDRMQELGVTIPAEGYHTAEYHTAEALAEYGPILDWDEVERQLSMENFLRDGVLVLRIAT